MSALHNATQWGLGLGLMLLLVIHSGCANQFDVDELEFGGENSPDDDRPDPNNLSPEQVRAQCLNDCAFITNNCTDEISLRCGPESAESFTPDSCPMVCGEPSLALLIVNISSTRSCDDIANQFAAIDPESCSSNNDVVGAECGFDGDCGEGQGCINGVCLANCLDNGDCNGMPLCNNTMDFCARPDEACFAACVRVAISCPEDLDILCNGPYPDFFDDCNNFCGNPSPGAADLGQSFFAPDCFDTAANATAVIPAAQEECFP